MKQRARGAARPARRRGARAGRADAGAADAPTRCRREAIVKHYETVLTLEALDAWIARLEARRLAALDTETDSLDPMRARLIGISLVGRAGRGRATSRSRHSYAGAPDQLPLERGARAAEALARGRGARPRSASNIKYDSHVFANARHRRCAAIAHDTLLQSYVLEAHKPHSLESLAERHLGRTGAELRGRVRQGREPDPVRAGRGRRAPPSTRARTAR